MKETKIKQNEKPGSASQTKHHPSAFFCDFKAAQTTPFPVSLRGSLTAVAVSSIPAAHSSNRAQTTSCQKYPSNR
jgi:hypothetical protein